MYSNPIDLLKAFLSNDAAAQKEAEKNLNQLAKNEPLVSMDLHTSALDNQDLKIAQLAAVSLKQYHLQGMDDFDRIPKEKLQALEKKIFDLFLEGNRPLQLYKRLMELLVLLYANNNDQYSYLVKNVLAMDKAENDNIKISVMFFIEILCENCFNEEHLKEAAADLIRIFENHISDSNIAVGIAAVKGIISLLANIEDKTFVKKFSEILPVLLKTLVAAVKHDEDSGVAIIQSLGELIEIHPSFIKPIVEDLLLTLAEILKEKKFSDGIRNQAMNCIEMLASHCDVAVRKSEAFKNTLIPTFIEVLCEIKEFSLDEWMKDIEGLIISKGDPYFTVQDTIARLSDSLTSKFLLPQFIPYITQCIQNGQWYIKYAGFTAIGVLAQGCAGSFKSELDQIMQLVMSGFDHQDPRVVYASTTAVAHLSNEFQPDLQKKYNKPVLETIIKMLNNEECLKLQLQGARVIVNFCEDIEKIEEEHKIVTPYASELLPALLKLFKKSMTLNSDIALSDSLIGLSMLASVIDLEFAKYANDFLPELKYLLETIPNTDEKHTNIRIEAMECIGFIITSFRNQEGFLQEVDSIMEYLVNLQKNLAKDDPEQASILDVYAQVSSHTLDKFLKYMPHVYDNLLEAVDIEVKISIHKHDDHEEMQKKKFAISGKVESNLVTFDNFVFDTSAFAIKLGALTTLSAFAVNLGKHFRPYIASALPKVVKCFESKEKNISKKSLKTIKHFLNDCETEAEKGEVIALCLPHMYTAINNHVLKENDPKAVATHYIYKQIAKAIDFLNEPVLSEQTVSDLLNSMSSSLTFLSDEKKKIVIKVKELEDCDDQKKEEIENQYEETNNIMHIIMDICGKLLKLYGPKVEGLIGHGIIPYYYNFFSGTEAAVLDSDLLYSICIVDDLLEFSSQEMFERFVQQATTKLMEYAKKPASLSILQSAVFGLGTASKRMNAQLFSQYRNDLLQIISNVVTSKDAFSEEKAEATENAIGALGKIALFQFQKNDKISEEVLLKFLQLLPLKNDFEEAQIVHKMLLEEILKKNDALFSTSQDIQNAAIKAVLDISKAISADSELEILNEEGKGLMAQVLQQMNK